MNPEAIKLWLKRKKSSGTTARGLTALAALLGGLFILFLTFWFTYAVIWICIPGVSAVSELAFSKKLRLAHEWRLILSGIFLLLLFIQHFRTSPWHWGDYPRDHYSVLVGPTLGPWALVRHPGASANMIADILLSGPRLVMGAWNLWREVIRLRALDVEVGTQLLVFLLNRGELVPYVELEQAGWAEWFGPLRSLEGLVFLEKGLKLSSELHQELINLTLD